MKPEEFIKQAAKKWGVTYEDVLGHVRQKYLVDIRTNIALALRNEWNMSFKHIARVMNRDHTSIISLCKRSEKARERTFKIPDDPLGGVSK